MNVQQAVDTVKTATSLGELVSKLEWGCGPPSPDLSEGPYRQYILWPPQESSSVSVDAETGRVQVKTVKNGLCLETKFETDTQPWRETVVEIPAAFVDATRVWAEGKILNFGHQTPLPQFGGLCTVFADLDCGDGRMVCVFWTPPTHTGDKTLRMEDLQYGHPLRMDGLLVGKEPVRNLALPVWVVRVASMALVDAGDFTASCRYDDVRMEKVLMPVNPLRPRPQRVYSLTDRLWDTPQKKHLPDTHGSHSASPEHGRLRDSMPVFSTG